MKDSIPLTDLLADIRRCHLCADLPLGPRPVLSAAESARILIIGQAPGTRVHKTGIPWNDPSGDKLREWLGISKDSFYDEQQIAIVPMGFCYPGKGRSGDLPPRKECARHWHQPVMARLPNIQLTLLIGQYAQRYYLGDRFTSVTDIVKQWAFMPQPFFPLVHPSPRNRRWHSQNPWYEETLVPELRRRVAAILEH
ncbi:MAG: uracil-DNA glycosylase family protein [Porticoccaceae bacterium]|nr:uracil-DNA glycosylase family protein [Porticoccaceae bacterium]